MIRPSVCTSIGTNLKTLKAHILPSEVIGYRAFELRTVRIRGLQIAGVLSVEVVRNTAFALFTTTPLEIKPVGWPGRRRLGTFGRI